MYTFIEVCAGGGGLSSGFIEAGLKPVLLNEIDKHCCETLRNNHSQIDNISEIVVNSDMKSLNLTKYKNKVDVLCGGVPCQSFSIAGERKGLEDDRGQLIIEFNRLINEVCPKIFMIENVKGLLNHNKGHTFKSVIDLLCNDDSYKIYYKVLNSKDYKVPQKRERVIIIGINQNYSTKEFTFPKKHEQCIYLKDILANVPKSIGALYSKEKYEIMKLVPPGGCWVDLPEDIKKKYMGASLESGGGKRGIARRLSMNELCLTLTTSPNQKQTERCHPIETRPLNVREYARIQTFPDSYNFSGSMHQQYKQIGNAIPVKMAYYIGKSIIEYLDSVK